MPKGGALCPAPIGSAGPGTPVPSHFALASLVPPDSNIFYGFHRCRIFRIPKLRISIFRMYNSRITVSEFAILLNCSVRLPNVHFLICGFWFVECLKVWVPRSSFRFWKVYVRLFRFYSFRTLTFECSNLITSNFETINYGLCTSFFECSIFGFRGI